MTSQEKTYKEECAKNRNLENASLLKWKTQNSFGQQENSESNPRRNRIDRLLIR